MKLRIKGNSVRYRLTRSEVSSFASNGYQEEKTVFGNTEFIYAIQISTDIDAITATFNEGKMTLLVPAATAGNWATNNIVGYNNTIDTGNGNKLSLLLEKDFVCLDAPPTEDQSDNYENPNKVC